MSAIHGVARRSLFLYVVVLVLLVSQHMWGTVVVIGFFVHILNSGIRNDEIVPALTNRASTQEGFIDDSLASNIHTPIAVLLALFIVFGSAWMSQYPELMFYALCVAAAASLAGVLHRVVVRRDATFGSMLLLPYALLIVLQVGAAIYFVRAPLREHVLARNEDAVRNIDHVVRVSRDDRFHVLMQRDPIAESKVRDILAPYKFLPPLFDRPELEITYIGDKHTKKDG